MKPTLIRSSKQVLVLLFLLVLRGADSEDDLSKYVIDHSFEKSGVKLRKNIELHKKNDEKSKKMTKKRRFLLLIMCVYPSFHCTNGLSKALLHDITLR